MKGKYLYSCCKYFPPNHKVVGGRCLIFLIPKSSINLFVQEYTPIVLHKLSFTASKFIILIQ